jgi:hypothetical protein
MDKDHVSAFASGEPNTAYPQYFTGQSYLKMLTKGKIPVANVTFEPGCRNHWHIHHKGGQILLCAESDIIRNGDSLRAVLFPEMSLRLRLRSSTGTVLRRIPGSRTLPLKCRLKALRMNGAKK